MFQHRPLAGTTETKIITHIVLRQTHELQAIPSHKTVRQEQLRIPHLPSSVHLCQWGSFYLKSHSIQEFQHVHDIGKGMRYV